MQITLPADETRGGIAIAWNRDFITCHSLKPDRKDYSLSMQITLNLTNSSFLLTAVYRPTEHSEKMNFLAELISCQPTQPTPWICLGDFKLIYEARDKNNNNINRRLMGRFRRALDASELMELRLQNRRYTWRNGRARPTLVHLDRVFCNKEWDAIFQL